MAPEGTRRDLDDAARELLANIKRRMHEIDELLRRFPAEEEDGVYRYYHKSIKVYGLQMAIEKALSLFESIAPGVLPAD